MEGKHKVIWSGKSSYKQFKFYSFDYFALFVSVIALTVLCYLFAMIVLKDIFVHFPSLIQAIIIVIVASPLIYMFIKTYKLINLIKHTEYKLFLSEEENILYLVIYRNNKRKRIEQLNGKYIYITRKKNDVYILNNYVSSDIELFDYKNVLWVKSKPIIKMIAIEKKSFHESIKNYFKNDKLTRDYIIGRIENKPKILDKRSDEIIYETPKRKKEQRQSEDDQTLQS